jgi:succinoglycan biosynthesis protein ExoM
MGSLPHVCVCVCTYKRPHLLTRLFEDLGRQETDGLFSYSIVVADNDHLESAKDTVRELAASSDIPIEYCVEPRQNIALARNKAIECSHGDFVSFIDDDEFPTRRWLVTLFRACRQYEVDGALGPVKPHFDDQAPAWVVKGKFYDRPSYPTGFIIDWRKGRTGNVLLKKHLFDGDAQPFRPQFRVGEDQDFFRRMIERGHAFVWCDEALAYEVVPPIRWKRTFLMRRALLMGVVSRLHPSFGAVAIVKSAIAVPVYAVALPPALLLGQGPFMYCLMRLCNHIGRVLATLGINPIRDQYVTD